MIGYTHLGGVRWVLARVAVAGALVALPAVAVAGSAAASPTTPLTHSIQPGLVHRGWDWDDCWDGYGYGGWGGYRGWGGWGRYGGGGGYFPGFPSLLLSGSAF